MDKQTERVIELMISGYKKRERKPEKKPDYFIEQDKS